MTSIRHRLLIDECLPPKLISIYLSSHINLSGDGVSAVHANDHLAGGKKDPDWVPAIARDRRWCILSEDKGSHSKRMDALPILCAEFDITLIRISAKLKARSLAFYGPHLLSHWQKFMEILNGPKGSQYMLRLHQRIADYTHFVATRAPDGYHIENGILLPDQPAMTA